MSLAHRPELLRIAGNLFEAFVTRRRSESLTVKGLAFQLLDIVFDEIRGPFKAGDLRAHPGVLRAKALMENEYLRELTLQDIAAHARLSVSHLSSLFVRFMGAPPMEYLLRIRLSEAKLLLSKGGRVKEVAHDVGFRSPHYFARFFRKRTGLSPREFTARHCLEYRSTR
jgi:AraC-like DNA-binding protein